MLPVLASAILKEAPSFAGENALRLQILSVNLSTLFACIFVGWIITLTVALAPGSTSRWLIITGMAGGLAFRALQDSWTIDELNITGRELAVENLEILSPLFILHALVSLIMLVTLVMLAVWLVRKEKAENIAPQPLWFTIIQLLAFPIGLFWIQKRAQAVSFEDRSESEA